MTPAQIGALLDAQDVLVEACIGGGLSLAQFTAAYGDFPASYGLDAAAHEGDPNGVPREFLGRLQFHCKVSSLLRSVPDAQAGGFLDKAVLMRLRQLVAAQKTGPADTGW